MFCVGDTVIYGTQGVCRIVGTEENDLGGDIVEYYVLKPVCDENSTVFVPMENKTLLGRMRSVLSEEEIYALIKNIPEQKTIWIDDENKRKTEYQAIINRGDRKDLISLIKTLYGHRLEQQKKGRKLHMTDESFLKQAESLLYSEFALVLNIQSSEVLPFITEQIESSRKTAN